MNSNLKKIVELRVLIGYLGERNQANWWSSDFLSSTASTFLGPIFNRSLFLAQYQGVTAAAAKIHDGTIGVGQIYHLFRLPMLLEQSLADILLESDFIKALQSKLISKEVALNYLAELVGECELDSPVLGPVRLGNMGLDIADEIQYSAKFYYLALKTGVQTFPYIREAL